jgi:hypothetical protein
MARAVIVALTVIEIFFIVPVQLALVLVLLALFVSYFHINYSCATVNIQSIIIIQIIQKKCIKVRY